MTHLNFLIIRVSYKILLWNNRFVIYYSITSITFVFILKEYFFLMNDAHNIEIIINTIVAIYFKLSELVYWEIQQSIDIDILTIQKV